MTYSATAYRLLVSVPGDVRAKDVTAVSQAVARWNVFYGQSLGVVVVPVHWETHSAAEDGQRPQAVLNQQLVDDADIVVALFWHRIGTPTGEAESGTIEELSRAHDAGAHVAILECRRALPPDVDTDQLAALRKYLVEKRATSLVLSYETEAELERHIDAILMRAVTKASVGAELAATGGALASGVWPRVEREQATVTDSQGRLKVDRRWYLILKNVGSRPVQDVRFRFEAEQPDDQLPLDNGDNRPLETLAPGGEASYGLGMHLGVASQARGVVTWLDGEESHENVATLRFF